MKYRYGSLILVLLLMVVLAGCGGGVGGGSSSTGTEDTGILITSTSVLGPGEGAAGAPDVDAATHLCASGDPEDGLFAVEVTMDVAATRLTPDAPFEPFPATVEECTITYRKANEDPGSPIIEQWTQYPNCILSEGTTSCGLRLIDIERKRRWWDDYSSGKFTPGEYPTHYVAVFKCKYTGQFGKSGFFQSEYDFWMADFDNC